MKVTGKIESVSNISSGVSQQGKSWKSCEIVVFFIDESGMPQRVLIHALNDACDMVQNIVVPCRAESLEYVGTFDCYYNSRVRNYTDKNNVERRSLELSLISIVKK